jgi:hypothetical protein
MEACKNIQARVHCLFCSEKTEGELRTGVVISIKLVTV